MKLLVTGGTGFIGSHFLNACAEGHVVIAFRRPGSTPRISLRREPKWIEAGLDSVALSREICEDAVLVHFAAYGVSPQPCDWEEALRTNFWDAFSFIKEAREKGVTRVVVCGSCVEYGRSAERYEAVPPNAPLEPVGPYAGSKAALSVALLAWATQTKTPLAILRPFNVFGEGQFPSNFWSALRKAALAGEDFAMTSGEQIRDFVPVEEVAGAFLRACARPDLTPGIPMMENLGTGRAQTLRNFAESWWSRWEATGRLLYGAKPDRLDEVRRYVPAISN